METVNKIIAYLDGKKTYIIGAFIVVLNALIMSGVVSMPNEYLEAINYILIATGLTTLRVGVSKETKKIESVEK